MTSKHLENDYLLLPFYEGKFVYNETCFFLEGEEALNLIFPAVEILSIWDYKFQVLYEEGVDYLIDDKGKLVRTKNSRIPTYPVDKFYPKAPKDDCTIKYLDKGNKYHFKEQRYIIPLEEDLYTSSQIVVTYKHQSTWEGHRFIYQGDRLSNFVNRLKNKQESTIVFYGDSITVGCDASGTIYGGNIPPYLDPWALLVTKELERKYQTKLNYVNTAVGGTTTEWGLKYLDENVIKYHPDFVVIAFGMNDYVLEPATYKEYLVKMVERIKEDNSNVNIIIVSTTVPNPESSWYCNQAIYINTIKDLNLDGVAIVDMTSIHQEILNRKTYKDISANNVNHPNDFIIRLYATALLKTINDN